MTEKTITAELSSVFDPQSIQGRILARWDEQKPFAAGTRPAAPPYVIMMPLPNVTGALHMGHAMDNVMQDLLTRWHRMQGDDALWQPGTDHAGIATQAVVERRLFEIEGRTRHDIGREELVRRIWAWKDEYQTRIVTQQKAMGCGCDWARQRFTMDPVCSAAVREAFFRLFRDRLIYRGDRLVNWDCALRTAVSDDEIEVRETSGAFYYLKYPVIDPKPGEPEYVIVATTRPETMLGDTAVACHPQPALALEKAIRDEEKKLQKATSKTRNEHKQELERLHARVASHQAALEQLAAMARDGRMIRLPLQERAIPLITDEWAKPALGSGCVKITPAHDPNDYDVQRRHADRVAIVNILNEDGTLNEHAGAYRGLDRFDARKKVFKDLEALGLVEKTEQRLIELGYSDRSNTIVEPYLSKQWFVRMGDVPGGVHLGRDAGVELKAPGLAQAAIDAANGVWRSPTGRQLEFFPDDRYKLMYEGWLGAKRDWCISRQLWWGHQIPVWRATFATVDDLARAVAGLPDDRDLVHAWIGEAGGEQRELAEGLAWARAQRDAHGDARDAQRFDLEVCLRSEAADQRYADALVALGLMRDPDVLDTWFSSALWPFSTLGWPDPDHAKIDPGQTSLRATENQPSALERFYPGSCLVTGRDIVTLWVARMVMLGLHAMGDLPFTHVFVHANIQDGKGVRMSKSKGNGIDPLDIIDSHGVDAMRYVLCEMQTGSQDIRIPVQAISPFSEERQLVDLATAQPVEKRLGQYVDPVTKQAFDVIGTWEGVPKARTTSDRFDIGRNFCNKLWNATRFLLGRVSQAGRLEYRPLSLTALPPEDRWLLSRLSNAARTVTASLADYNPSQALAAARDFFRGDLCDWYIEIAKPREDPQKDQVLAAVLDQTLRLLHPIIPFITEELWAHLGAVAPVRGIDAPFDGITPVLVRASWPQARPEWEDKALEAELERMRGVITAIRDLRAVYKVPKGKLDAVVRVPAEALRSLQSLERHIISLADLSSLQMGEAVERPRNAAMKVSGDADVFVTGLFDPATERARLEKETESVTRQLDGLLKRLDNAAFLEKAPEQAAAAKAKAAELQAQLRTLEESLGALS